MIVADEYPEAMGLTACLAGLGYRDGGWALSGEEALARAARRRPGLVLMDVYLRGELDGIETARLMRRNLNVPVIFLTAYADLDLVGRAVKAGPFGYILKPAVPYELRAAIEVALKRAAVEADLVRRREHFRLAAEHCLGWETWLGLNGRFIYVSPGCERLTGLSPEALLEAPERLLGIVHAEDRPGVAEHMRRIGEIRGSEEIEFRLSGPAGRVRHIRHVCRPVRDETGVLLGRRASHEDLTGLKAAETERLRLEAELRTARARIRAMEGLLPFCGRCGRFWTDEDYRRRAESFIRDPGAATAEAGLCPACAGRPDSPPMPLQPPASAADHGLNAE